MNMRSLATPLWVLALMQVVVVRAAANGGGASTQCNSGTYQSKYGQANNGVPCNTAISK